MGTELLYEDDHVVAFRDIHPQNPVHILVIPRNHISEFYRLSGDEILPSVRTAIQELIEKSELTEKGYRIEVNGGGAQLVDHLHFHLMGPMGSAV